MAPDTVSAQFFHQFFVAMNDPVATLDVSFGREAAPTFTAALERRAGR